MFSFFVALKPSINITNMTCYMYFWGKSQKTRPKKRKNHLKQTLQLRFFTCWLVDRPLKAYVYIYIYILLQLERKRWLAAPLSLNPCESRISRFERLVDFTGSQTKKRREKALQISGLFCGFGLIITNKIPPKKALQIKVRTESGIGKKR